MLLVEDNEVYRDTLELLLGQEDSIAVIGAVGDVGAARSALDDEAPDVVVLDLRLPGVSGADAVRAIGASAPDARILCLTAEATSELTDAARAAGAWDVLEKDASTRDVANAIRSAAHG